MFVKCDYYSVHLFRTILRNKKFFELIISKTSSNYEELGNIRKLAADSGYELQRNMNETLLQRQVSVFFAQHQKSCFAITYLRSFISNKLVF